ncbi:MAG: hypothetical protein ACK54J_12350, partial [Pseudanabaena sp.]
KLLKVKERTLILKGLEVFRRSHQQSFSYRRSLYLETERKAQVNSYQGKAIAPPNFRISAKKLP